MTLPRYYVDSSWTYSPAGGILDRENSDRLVPLPKIALLLNEGNEMAVARAKLLDIYDTITPARLTKPLYLQTLLEHGYGTQIRRICNDAGIDVPVIGGTWKGDWSRHRYSKRQPWSSDGKYILIDQKYSANPARIVLSAATMRPVFGSRILAGTAPTAGSPTAKLLAAREVQWRPDHPTQMVSYKRITSPFIGIEIEVWDVLTGDTVGTVIQISTEKPPLPSGVFYPIADADLGWIGEGQISDDGNWTVVGTHLPAPQDNAGNDDFIVVVDLENCVAGEPVDVSAQTNLYQNASRGAIGNIGISCLGNFAEIKLSGDTSEAPDATTGIRYAQQPAFIYYIDKDELTASVNIDLDVNALRMAAAVDAADAHGAEGASNGMIAWLSHPCMNIDSQGREVMVGGARNWEASNVPVPDLGSGADWSKRRRIGKFYGHCIMIDLETGLHTHVSPGVTQCGTSDVANVQHTSGMAYRRRGWHCITTDMEAPDAWGASELQMVYLDAANTPTGTRSFERWCRLRTDDTSAAHAGTPPSGYDSDKYNSEAHAAPNPTGTQIMFASNWMIDSSPVPSSGPFDNKSYIVMQAALGAIRIDDRGGDDNPDPIWLDDTPAADEDPAPVFISGPRAELSATSVTLNSPPVVNDTHTLTITNVGNEPLVIYGCFPITASSGEFVQATLDLTTVVSGGVATLTFTVDGVPPHGFLRYRLATNELNTPTRELTALYP